MINTNLTVDSINSNTSNQVTNDIKEESNISDLFESSNNDNNADEVNFSDKVKDLVKKEHKSNKEFSKNMFNSYTQGKNGKFSLGKTALNVLCTNLCLSSPVGWALGGIKLAGNFISHKINSEEN